MNLHQSQHVSSSSSKSFDQSFSRRQGKLSAQRKTILYVPSTMSLWPNVNARNVLRRSPPSGRASRCVINQENMHMPIVTKFTRANIPNLLTYARVAAIPLLVAVGVMPPFSGQCAITASVFAVASITDLLDGYLARRWKVISAMGIFLDPVADKLIVAVALILLCIRFPILAVVLSSCVIIVREIFISALREWMALRQKSAVVKVSPFGKLKTATQMISISALLATPYPYTTFAKCAIILLVTSALFTFLSAVNYVRAAVAALTKPESNT